MNLLIEYYVPPTRGIFFLQAFGVLSEEQARELFKDQVPAGIIRSIKPCDEKGSVLEQPTVDDV